jgi:dynein heavy chain
MIDPQRQANKYIKSYGKVASEGGMNTVKLSDPGLLQSVELGIQFGKWILLENIGEALDPALEPVLQQQKIRDGTSWVIKLGDKNVSYDEKFRFFITTTLANPHYSPETSVKVTLLNFAITPEGLQDQMLGIVVQKEQPEMEEKKQELVKNNAAMMKTLKEIEDTILRLLAADGDILESKELIDTLDYSKKTSAVINKAMEEAKVTEVEIDEVRKSYRDYAFRASLLFFCVVEMQVIDPMYQFSLQWFQQLASMGIDNAPQGETPEVRLDNLITYFTYSIYQSICRGLFEKHKLLFSFSLTLKILSGMGKLDMQELRFLLAGPTGEVKDGLPNPAPKWLADKSWNEVLTLAQLPAFQGFDAFFTKEHVKFQRLYDVPETDKEPIPGDWDDKLNALEKMCVLRTIRCDRVTTAVLSFVKEEMGQKFVEPPVFDIAVSYEDSTKMSPLVFVLVPGSDPVAEMLLFAESKGMTAKLDSISLGQGQGPKAQRMIDRARETGSWVLLCNCHLSISWLPELERICEQQNADETDNAYRLWLTSMPTPAFPALLLQNGVKMTNEPPKGLRANVLGSMMKCDDKMLSDCAKPEAYSRLVFGFCFFHAVCQDRRKFGPIGWNIPYNFTPEDLVTNRRQLKYFLDNYDAIPYKVLQFLGAAINYGGRVTDKKDKILIETMIKLFICEPIVTQGAGYKFSAGGLFYCPNADCQDKFLEYLRGLPLTTPPEVFGLHENCEMTCAEGESLSLLADVQALGASAGGGGGGEGGGKSAEEIVDDLAGELITMTPPCFDLDLFEEKFPTMYGESRNTVAKQEAFKYNNLLILLHAQLPLYRRAAKGLVVMTDDLEAVGKGLFLNQVPEGWGGVGFLSMKPLTSWYKDLNDRIDFFKKWYDLGHPISFWVSGLFFPQAFLTAVMQNFARKFKYPIDRINFATEVYDNFTTDGSDITEVPEAGQYMWGMFLEGCRWDDVLHALAPSNPKQLFTSMPVVLFKPVYDFKATPGRYPCPVYKVLSRKGTLSTTGHSTNFVRDMEVPTIEDPDWWVRAGVACFLALKY